MKTISSSITNVNHRIKTPIIPLQNADPYNSYAGDNNTPAHYTKHRPVNISHMTAQNPYMSDFSVDRSPFIISGGSQL